MNRVRSLLIAALTSAALSAGSSGCGGVTTTTPGLADTLGAATDAGCDGTASIAMTAQASDVFGAITYFANGATLPAGHYRAKYVDGCMKYAGVQDWAVNAYAGSSPDGWWLVGSTSDERIVVPPGTVGFLVSNGGFATFDACVTANQALAPVDFDFFGGKMGVWLSDGPYTDNVSGQDGRNPQWELEYPASCRP